MVPRTIPLGFEIGSGTPVTIPIKHLAITGQTQEAGKTTALEALIARSGLRAVTFITKRGEGSFAEARRIDPYFREQADWQFVASILEASRGEKLKFERAWIIRASKGARTLADVHRNVKKALETAKGLSGDVYLTLDAYLEAVVPQIARVRWAPRVELAAGVNAVDLTALTLEMQHLVIKSTLDWVLEHEQDTVVVVPEAWKFIPQGRGTPVKLAAESFIRQAAGLQNFLWLDSQDIAGVEKIILKSVPLWILGVQREANEVKRTLDNIPAGTSKPTAAAVATLELGQFYACWGRHAIKTYVQPAWMSAVLAAQVATGAIDVETAKHLSHGRWVRRRQEDSVTKSEAARLEQDNKDLATSNAMLSKRIEELEKTIARLQKGTHGQTDARSPEGSRAGTGQDQSRAAEDVDAPGRHGVRPTAAATSCLPTRTFTAEESLDNEALYQAIKARLIEELPSDARVMELVLSRPELRVKVERQIIDVSEDSTRGLVAKLIADGFYETGQSSSATLKELARRGQSLSPGTLYPELDKLAAMGFFRIVDGKDERGRPRKEYHLVPDMKVNVVEA